MSEHETSTIEATLEIYMQQMQSRLSELEALTAASIAAAEQAEQFLASAPDLVAIAGFDGIYQRLNPLWEGTLGYSVDELRAKPLIQFIVPDDRARMQAAIRAAIADERIGACRCRHMLKAGGEVELEWRVTALPDRELLYIVVRDTRPMDQAIGAELSVLRSLLERLPDGMLLFDATAHSIYANPAAALIVGEESSDLLIGREMRTFFAEDERERVDDEIGPALVRDGVWRGVVRVLREDDSTTPGRATVFVLSDAEGGVLGLAMLLRAWTPAVEGETAAATDEERLVQYEQMLVQQKRQIRALSAPLVALAEGVVALFVVGILDPKRTDDMLETLMTGISTHAADTVLIDVASLTQIDEPTVQTLLRMIQAVELVGGEVALTGIRPDHAKALVALRVDFGELATFGSLQMGLAWVLGLL